MELDDSVLESALRSAESFLSRWRDPTTRNLRDDLAQEAVLVLWRRRHTLRRARGAFAFVRTVSRRLRHRAVTRSASGESRHRFEAVSELGLVAADRVRDAVCIDGAWIPTQRALEELDAVLGALRPLNATLLRGYYAGRSCDELGREFALPPACVKARLYRSRRRIRRWFEGRVRSRALGA